VTETKTTKSRRVVPFSPAAEGLLRDVRASQRVERLRAGQYGNQTSYMLTTELGEPCDSELLIFVPRAAHGRRLAIVSLLGPEVSTVAWSIWPHLELRTRGSTAWLSSTSGAAGVSGR
jgi:hypothetical protein